MYQFSRAVVKYFHSLGELQYQKHFLVIKLPRIILPLEVLLPLKTLGRISFFFFVTFSGCQQSRVILGMTEIFASVLFPLWNCIQTCLSLQDTSYRIRDNSNSKQHHLKFIITLRVIFQIRKHSHQGIKFECIIFEETIQLIIENHCFISYEEKKQWSQPPTFIKLLKRIISMHTIRTLFPLVLVV